GEMRAPIHDLPYDQLAGCEVSGREVGQCLDGVAEPDRPGLVPYLPMDRGKTPDDAIERGLVHGLFRREVIEEHAFPDARGQSDLPGRSGAVTALGEDALGGVQYLRPDGIRITCRAGAPTYPYRAEPCLWGDGESGGGATHVPIGTCGCTRHHS